MKLALPALLLVAAATVSATELQDPAAVRREWDKTATPLSAPAATPSDLRAQCPAPLPRLGTVATAPELPPASVQKSQPFDGMARPPGFDAKRMPKGAKSYEFQGETYWLVPIAEGRSS